MKVALLLLAACALSIVIEPRNLLPRGLATSMYRAEKVELYRLDPADFVEEAETRAGNGPAAGTVVSVPADSSATGVDKLGVRPLAEPPRFHGYKVTESATVADAQQIVDLVRSMERSMGGDISPAKGFIPEYGLRFTSGQATEELIMSPKCLQLSWQRRGAARELYLIRADECGQVIDALLHSVGDSQK